MSKSEAGDASPERQAFQALESAVTEALERIRDLSQRVEVAETRRDEVEVLLRDMTDGRADPAEMSERLSALEVENADLRARVDAGYEAVERLLSQLRFLEEQS